MELALDIVNVTVVKPPRRALTVRKQLANQLISVLLPVQETRPSWSKSDCCEEQQICIPDTFVYAQNV